MLSLLKSRYVLICLGAVLLIALHLVLGAFLDWSLLVRLVGVIVVLVLLIVALAVGFVRASQSASAIEQAIKLQAQQQVMNTRPDRRAEIEALQEQLGRAIDQLKQSKLGRGRRGKAALYALPWYLLIGPPGAGKTTTIANSGLNFPLGSDRIHGVGGTRNCDWFFSDAAIFLDTAGRYTTEYEDNEEWLSFLETLRKHRSEQPINGVVVAVSIADLLAAGPNELLDHADTIRRRIDELIKHLGVRFPVYVNFTKCDLLQGFVELFGDMTRAEREQIWGVTLEADEAEGSLREVFEREFDRLGEALVGLRTARLSRPMKRAARHKVYAFPLQFASAKEPLARFAHQLFLPNPYQESPILRGFYFTSGTQEGVPLDRVIQAIAERFNLPGTIEGFEAPPEAKSYFIKSLFTDVIIPDRYLVERTSRSTRQGRLVQAGVAAAAAVVLALFVVWASFALGRGLSKLSATEAAAGALQGIRWNGATSALDLARLDSLGRQTDALRRSSLLGLGLQPRGEVSRAAHRLYRQNLQSLTGAMPLAELERRLRTSSSGMPRPAKDSLFQDLKAYLLLTSEAQRLRETAQQEDSRAFLRNHLTDLVAAEVVRNNPSTPSPETRERARSLMGDFVGELAEGEHQPFAGQERLVQAARRAIGEVNISVYYGQVLDDVGSEPPANSLTVRELAGAQHAALFQDPDRGVDRVFTREAYDEVMSSIAAKSENPFGDTWVLDQEAAVGSQEEIESRLKSLYYDDYAAEWTAFLRDVRLRPLGGIQEAARKMADLADVGDSPLVHLLAQATIQTSLKEMTLAGTVGQALDSLSGAEPHPVDQRFAWLHAYRFDQQPSMGSPVADEVLQSLGEVGADLEMVEDSGEEALRYAARLLGGERPAIDGALRDVGRQLSGLDDRVRRNLFEEPILQAGAAVIGAAQQGLHARWQEQVYRPFQDVAGAYPFNTDATQEVPLDDFADLFDPEQGRVAAFLEELSPYLERGNPERPRRWQGYGLTLSEEAREALERARALGSTLFQDGQMQLGFRLRPDRTEGLDGAPPAGPVRLNLHGQQEEYSQGNLREQWAFIWPGPEKGVELRVTGQEGPLATKQEDGAWALFRFMSEASGSFAGATSRYVWTLEGGGGAYRLRQPFDLDAPSDVRRALAEPGRFFAFEPPEALN